MLTSSPLHVPEWDQVVGEVSDLLSRLIRIDTTNPPGNETPAAEFLRDFLLKEGFDPVLLESSEGRGNVIARLTGEGKKRLLLLSHLDVVPAEPSKWEVHPFSGEIKDGFVWGRGALDCKGLVAVEAMVMALLKREGFRPRGEVIFASTADEEMGGGAGAGWLVENHPELVKAEMLINEGGGAGFPINGRTYYLVQVAEKGVYWLRLRTRGKSAHASMPGVGENALLKMTEILEKIGRYRAPAVLLDVTRDLFKKFAGGGLKSWIITNPMLVDRVLDLLRRKNPQLAEFLRAMVRATMAPTMIKAGTKENIIPDECEAVVDCRLLPGQDMDYLLEQLEKAVGTLEGLEIEPITQSRGTISPYKTEFFRKIEEVMGELDPGSTCVPFMVTGGTDSRFFREKFGTLAYGFQPMKVDIPVDEFLKLPHGVNERISLNNLLFGTRVLYEVVKRVMK
ncbi:MAG: hypothetical protein DRO05_01945 [Thermoproteota archaeon]|nr:MAG: hypothetical protein DRO05_01945 [Candidatus Korarchaeota archaeon]